jgi:hypothetical protein
MRIKVVLLSLAATVIGVLVCLVLSPFLPPPWAWVIGIFIWAGVVAVCALALMALSEANEFWQALAVMWRPLALVLAGAFLLFFNDQGRELGVSLTIDNDGKRRFVFLFLALIYWAFNNWHSARLEIYGAVENGDLGVAPALPASDKPKRRVFWLFWLPRLLGVCAHLFAAINLSLAAWLHTGLLAWTAPVAIIVFTVLVYVFDRHALSEQTPDTRPAPIVLGATATVLEKIKEDLGPDGLRPYLFAISGVSGGSVGATAFDAALANSDEAACGKECAPSTEYLRADFLAPTLASGIFKDVPASFLPDLGQNDRGAALEQGFEHASQGLLERPFLSLFPYGDEAARWRPILLLNATHEESGKRIITSHVLIERNVFVDALDGLHVLDGDVRASTAAHNSARFSYISPAGNLGRRKGPAEESGSWRLTDTSSWKRWLASWNGSVIDGGYFENYGALTALELARAAKASWSEEKANVKLVILMISSDPDLAKAHTVVRIQEPKGGKECLVSSNEREPETPAQSPNYLSVGPGQVANAWVNEFAAPLQGVESAREAHGNRAAAELGIEVCAEFAQSAGISAGGAQTQAAVIADWGKDAYLKNSEPVKAKADKPYFAHLAMCKSDDQGDVSVQPPLGWVLSRATQTGLGQLLKRCDNEAQLNEFEAALGKQSR